MIQVPKIKGIIDRRILINYKVDLDALSKFLPPPFEPVDKEGYGVAGICLIRLKHIRPIGLPAFIGIGSENGAHRIAVRWREKGQYREGVYIPRRDTSLWINALVGGRLFPGEHHLSPFKIKEEGKSYEVEFNNKDGTHLRIVAEESAHFSKDSVFKDIEEASAFFEQGSLGYSPNQNQCFDGLELKTHNWSVQALQVKEVASSFFEDTSIFPPGSVSFDNALLMKGIEHEWMMREAIAASST